MSSELPLVSVCVQTYQHVNYIEQCLDGVLMQKTNFYFEIILGDDESTDGTRELCMAYAERFPEKIQLQLRHRKNVIYINGNPTGRFNFKKNLKLCQGKYIAILDGDDFWTDALKLQKQVDFLESNLDYSICWTNYKILEDDKLMEPVWTEALKNSLIHEVDFNNFGTPYCTHTLSCVFRKNVFGFNDLIKFKYFKDNSLFTVCLQKGKGAFLNFYGGVYRIHEQGVYSLASDYSKALSNYTNYEEILSIIPESRVPNVIGKRDDWESVFLRELYKLPISKFKKWIIRGKLYGYFKYLSIKS